jgi:hypothetical protein
VGWILGFIMIEKSENIFYVFDRQYFMTIKKVANFLKVGNFNTVTKLFIVGKYVLFLIPSNETGDKST